MINGKYPRVVIFEHNTYSVKPVYNDHPKGTKIVVVVNILRSSAFIVGFYQ